MIQLPLKQLEILLIHLKRDTKSLLFTVDHHTAFQKVKHDIDKFRFKIFLFNLIKLNVIVLNDLKLIASFIAW